MQNRTETLIFVGFVIVSIFFMVQNKELRRVNKELNKMVIDRDFLILEKNTDLAESNRQNATLEDNEYFYPVDRPVITSDIGIRISPITGFEKLHYGTDMYSNYTMNVYAVRDGEVVTHYPPPDGYHKGHPKFGGYIEIVDSNGMASFAHMAETFVREGQMVKAGDIIGTIGDTGLSKGLHLHFAYLLNIFKGIS